MDNPMVRVARLDHDQVYFGLVEKPLAEVQAGELVFGDPALAEELPFGARYVDRDCDLAAGAYRWESAAGAFEPLPSSQRKAAIEAPTLEQAFYDFVTDQGRITPSAPRVAAWAQWFRKSMEAIGK